MSEKPRGSIFDVVVIGAGLYGIQAARYFLDIHPNANVAILESDDVVGGTWSSKRIYDAFWTQNPIGMAEFSDQPMKLPPRTEQYYGFFPAKYVTQYLESYVDSHVYDGKSLRDRFIFNVRVSHVEKTSEGSWAVLYGNGSAIRASKLIDATGMTSEPHVPNIPGQNSFRGLSLHHKNFGCSTFLEDPKVHHVAIIGGAKSAADVAYASAKAGKTVSWIIREDGSGPAALLSPEGKGPYKNSNQSFHTRLLASFLPNPFAKMSPWSRFLHGTGLGRWLVKSMWDGIDRRHRKKVDYEREEGKEMGFKNLEPDTPVFWQQDSSGINQRPDFYSTIAAKVHVYRQSVDHLSESSIVLARTQASNSGPKLIPLDVLVYCTGWTPTSTLFSPATALELGLSVAQPIQGSTITSKWEVLEDAQDSKIVYSFPSLRHPPAYRKVKPLYTPFRLYKAVVPPVDSTDHSIVFLGKLVVGANFSAAEAQALWAVAYLDGKVKVEQSVMEEDVARTVAWCRRRYLNKGELGSYFFFDVVDYTDMLLEQLGLRSHRRKGWLRSLIAPCMAVDLRGLLDEYRSKYRE